MCMFRFHLTSICVFSTGRWERLGDIVVLPATSFKDPAWSSISNEVWCAVSKSLSANRLARQVCCFRTLHQYF